MPEMMKCGHTANAKHKGKPVCIICYGMNPGAEEVAETLPDLSGRQAKCPHCSSVVPSSFKLAFFEYRPNAEFDSYYSGCRGWD